jgi:hypothetical protein
MGSERTPAEIVMLKEHGRSRVFTPEDWWKEAIITRLPDPVGPAEGDMFIHPEAAGKPGALTRFPAHRMSGEFFSELNMYYEIEAVNQAGSPVWAVRGRHGHPPGTKAEVFRAVDARSRRKRGSIYVELHSAAGCWVIRLDDRRFVLPILPGIWHAVWMPPGSRLGVFAQVRDELAFETLPCHCNRREFVRKFGLKPSHDPTLR